MSEVIEEEDWRGVLAIIFSAIFGALAGLGLYLHGVPGFLAVTSVLMTPYTLVLKWYYQSK